MRNGRMECNGSEGRSVGRGSAVTRFEHGCCKFLAEYKMVEKC